MGGKIKLMLLRSLTKCLRFPEKLCIHSLTTQSFLRECKHFCELTKFLKYIFPSHLIYLPSPYPFFRAPYKSNPGDNKMNKVETSVLPDFIKLIAIGRVGRLFAVIRRIKTVQQTLRVQKLPVTDT